VLLCSGPSASAIVALTLFMKYTDDFGTYLRPEMNNADSNSADPFLSETAQQNTIVFQGAQWSYNDLNNEFSIETKNTGHLGPTYAGVRPVREGHHKHMLEPTGPRNPAQSAQAPVY
jgi:hypothetical protein